MVDRGAAAPGLYGQPVDAELLFQVRCWRRCTQRRAHMLMWHRQIVKGGDRKEISEWRVGQRLLYAPLRPRARTTC
jgi:hypothetical protein